MSNSLNGSQDRVTYRNGLQRESNIRGTSSKSALTASGHAKGATRAGADQQLVPPADLAIADSLLLGNSLDLYQGIPIIQQAENVPDGHLTSDLASTANGTRVETTAAGLTEWYGETVDEELPDFEDDAHDTETHGDPQLGSGLIAEQAHDENASLSRTIEQAQPESTHVREDAVGIGNDSTTPATDSTKKRSLDIRQLAQSGQIRTSAAVEDDIYTFKVEDHPSTNTQSPYRRGPLPSAGTRLRDDYRPKSSIPIDLAPEEYASECIVAAFSSRLSPFALHSEEYALLRTSITHQQITTYLHIRNGILRLWTKNPLISVTPEEAAGCAKDHRWTNAADVAYQWLVRKGYINFGCVEAARHTGMRSPDGPPIRKGVSKPIVIIGAGMAGLGCARQLEGLLQHFSEHWTSKGAEIPRVIVLEGRQRIGGRIYSHALRSQTSSGLPPGKRGTADMGAQIITGFDNGNPLSAIIRGQLGIHHHLLKDNSVLYDSDGKLADKDRDQRIERLYNEILERASVFRHKIVAPPMIEGDKELIEAGREPSGDGGKLISVLEDAAAPLPLPGSGAESTRNDLPETDSEATPIHTEVDRLTGKQLMHPEPSQPSPIPSEMRPKATPEPRSRLDLGATVKSTEHPTLGLIMDEAVKQYQKMQDLTAQDLRLVNWHYANLEYANAANVNQLSLSGWDQDTGNEFEGEHAQIIGGYQQVPRGIWQCPYPLDIRAGRAVKEVSYAGEESAALSSVRVTCQDGETIEAERVVSTLPLGVMKANSVQFTPSLPEWKTGAIERLGFGTLNKVVLVYEKAFWQEDRDMFGLLRDPVTEGSLNQSDYAQNRGRFYLFWNCLKTSGRPMLVALMAGDAADQTETATTASLISEASHALSRIFPSEPIPAPEEVIISRWGKDPFSRGSYSYVGARALPQDYELMAQPVGPVYFAGEATCGSHPATVHGAYLSGLRAASEVLTSLIGPIHVPTPLLSTRSSLPPSRPSLNTTPLKRKADELSSSSNSSALAQAQRQRAVAEDRRRALEAEIQLAIHESLGERPTKPEKSAANPFLLYQKDHWVICKDRCDAEYQKHTKNPHAKASRNDVRAALGLMWRNADAETKRPYLEMTSKNKEGNAESVTKFRDDLSQWDKQADALRRRMLDEEREKRSKAALEPKAQDVVSTEGEHPNQDKSAAKRIRLSAPSEGETTTADVPAAGSVE